MDDESAASEAVRNLNGHSIKGRAIKVEKSESKGKGKYGIYLLSNFSFCSFLGSYICIFFKVILISQMNAQTINKHLVSTIRVAKKNSLIICLHKHISKK